jgi:S-formylglutathione hydrolase FrmB
MRNAGCHLALMLASGGCAAAAHAPDGGNQRLASVRFESEALGVRKRFLRYLPPSYRTDPDRRFPVVYVLHGYGGSEAEWIVQGLITTMADSLVAAGMTEVILVLPDGDNSFWSDWAVTADSGGCATDTLRKESPATFCVGRSRYGSYVVHDLVEHVDRHFRTIAHQHGRAVLGVSMGGTGALTIGFTWPDRFVAVAALSAPASPLRPDLDSGNLDAALVATLDDWERVRGRPLNAAWRSRWGTDTSQWWRQDPARAAQRLVAAGGSSPRVLIEVGESDPYLNANRILHAELKGSGLVHAYLESPGAHEWSHWQKRGPVALRWLAQQFSP